MATSKPFADGTLWDKSTDPEVSQGAPGFIITASGHIVEVATGKYVSGTQSPPDRVKIATTPPGDGAHPPPDYGPPAPYPFPNVFAEMQHTLGRTLPASLTRMHAATASIRRIVARG